MFMLKFERLIGRTWNQVDLNFTRLRELRRIVKAFEPLSELEDVPTRVHKGVEEVTKNASFKPSENPFKTSENIQNSSLSRLDKKFSKDVAYSANQLHSNYASIPTIRDSVPSPLDPIDPADAPDLVPNTSPTFNLAAYVNKSETLQQLIKLGVDLSRLEKRKGIGQFVLKLDFENDMKQHLRFLIDLGLPAESLGEFVTKNPLIFKEDLGDMEVRVNYLELKKFQPEQIVRIVTKNPFWLMFTTKRIDQRLGHFQHNFELSGDEVRLLATKQPRLITYNMEHIRKSTFCIREQMGFEKEEVKCLLLSKPKLWMMDSNELTERFNYIHNTMNISHNQMVQCPEVLTSRVHRLKERHGFLEYLKKAQYNPSKELYVSLKRLVEGTDKEFAVDVAKSSLLEYNTYLRTL